MAAVLTGFYAKIAGKLKQKRYTVMMAALAGMAALGACGAADVVEEKPNIVLILADDMGYGDVSALNEDSKLRTENIDRLAREGVVFEDAHTSSSVSTPSRYGLLTGRYNWRSELKEGVLNGYSKALIEEGRRTVAGVLQDCGYTTACIGKWHLGWTWNGIEGGKDCVDFSKPIADGPTTRGFDYFYGIAASLDMAPYVYVENDRVTALPNRVTSSDEKFGWWRSGPTGADFEHAEVLDNLADRAVGYIEANAGGDKPFFLYLPLTAPHTPILPTGENVDRSGLNPYGDFVLMVDGVVGKVTRAVEDAGIADNTIIVFTTDNGCSPEADFEALTAMGHDPSYIYRGYKADLYEGGHRVPCVLRWLQGAEPHRVGQTVCLTDFYATLVAVAGGEIGLDEGEDSYNLLPLITEAEEGEPLREATVHHSIYGNFSIRKGHWKLLLAPSSGGWSYPAPGKDDEVIATLAEVQLYDLENDPEESVNVEAEYPEVVEELRALLRRYVDEGRSTAVPDAAE